MTGRTGVARWVVVVLIVGLIGSPAFGGEVSDHSAAVVPRLSPFLEVAHGNLSATGPTVTRVAGADRYETAIAASVANHPSGSDVVYVAVGTDFPDGIAAGPAAAAEGAPILLTWPRSLHPSTRIELQRLHPNLVVVVGGPAAIAGLVLSQIKAALPSADVVRRWGSNRYATAAAMSTAVFSRGVDRVFVATGQSFADALIAAPNAVRGRDPILLVRGTTLDREVRDELQRLSPGRIYVVGNVSAEVEAELRTIAAVTRITAADPYALSIQVSKVFYPSGAPTVYVALGSRYPDALAAGPLAGADPGPLLLVEPAYVPAVVSGEIERLNPGRIVIVGGSAAVSERVATLLAGGADPWASNGEAIYLTFDDGPNPTSTRVILDILDEYGVKATFFAIGLKINRYPEVARDILARGHSLQVHGLDHPDMTGMSYSSIAYQIDGGIDSILTATGTHPTCYRPPFGVMSGNIRSVAADRDLTIWMWDVDTADSLPGGSSSRILASSRSWRPGQVILGHDTLAYYWDDVLGTIIKEQFAKGHTFGTLCGNW
jgi:peptidoglycan/xylan/chitin deacetylase (PgdA/CDA1 family)